LAPNALEQSEEIPVTAIARRAIILPIIHLAEFSKFGLVPFVAIAVAQSGFGAIAVASKKPLFFSMWIPIASLVLVPLSVSWTRLAVEGTSAVRQRYFFSFGRTELASLGISLLLAAGLFGPFAICNAVAFALGWPILPILLGLILLVVGVALGFRLFFVLPGIALNLGVQFRESWATTKGSVWRIVGVMVLAQLPFTIAQSIIHQIEKLPENILILFILGLADVLLTVLLMTSAVGAQALIYAFKVGVPVD